MFSFLTNIWNSINGLLKKSHSIFCTFQHPRKDEPILPIQIPSPQIAAADSVSVSATVDEVDQAIQDIVKLNVSVQGEQVATHHQSTPLVEEEKEEEEQEPAAKVIKETEEAGEEEEQEPAAKVIKETVAVDKGRWIEHYCSHHRILLVGEGDFSFSACLAKAFGTAPNMVATSLDSLQFLRNNYWNAVSNIRELTTRKGVVMHGVDATEMLQHGSLGHLTFDRVVFNFPFAGFFRELSRDEQVQRHRTLVNLFLKNAKDMISEGGEIHVTHKTNEVHREWDLVSMASSNGLRLIDAVDFNLKDYPGYHTKYGFGGDKDFFCYPSKTYKFGVNLTC